MALVCPYDLAEPGGVQAHVQHLADRLRSFGDEVVVVAPTTDSSAGVLPAGGSWRIPFNGSLAPVAYSPRQVQRALGALRRFRPDVVHVHEPGAPLLSLLASLKGPRPMVGTFHAWSDRDLAYRIARPVVRRAAVRLDARIAVSAAALRYHADALDLPAGSFREIPNGVDVHRFAEAAPLTELTADGPPTLLFVGRLERRKGLEELVRAFVQLKAHRPSLRLLVVGEGPERDRCQALLPARLRESVAFLGRVHQADLPRLYASADVFVAPSLGGESFGVVLLEAMAAGTPVVASSIPGYRSVLRDGIDGRLVPPGDARGLAAAVAALLDNPALRGAMSTSAREAVRAYDWEVVTRRLRQVYREVSGEAGGDPAPAWPANDL
ncbi:MAG TPA: glycosyltransferase family 4 protein [Nitriliruptorales bacterium]|nr:glycosyltransferase family 4 protein [Nitriliruptorales bacterium]